MQLLIVLNYRRRGCWRVGAQGWQLPQARLFTCRCLSFPRNETPTGDILAGHQSQDRLL